MNFFDKLQASILQNQSLLFVSLDPNPELLPAHYTSEDIIANLHNWLEFIIRETSDYVCAYKPTFGLYQALGIPGLELLENTLAIIPGHIPVILDAKHSDLNSSTVFAHRVFTQLNVDAVTLSPYTGQDHVAPFLVYLDKAVFILCSTSNPGAEALQKYPSEESPLYLQVVKESRNWGTPEQLGLEVGTTNTEVLARIRSTAPERIIMARSIWSQGSNIKDILAAGLNKNGDGLLIPVPQDILSQPELAAQIQSLRAEINQAKTDIVGNASTCALWLPDVSVVSLHPQQDLILQLYDVGCIMFGSFVQASGATFPYYIDLRKIISNPQIFNQVLTAYAEILNHLQFDRLAGIPYGSLPTATGLSLRLHCPLIFPRKEVKAHGTRRLIEGNFHPGETVAVVDDILITGKSVMEGAQKLKSEGLNVQDIVVLIDHEKGVKARLLECGYQAYSVFTLSEITETLYQCGRINQEQFLAFHESEGY
jgi:uridine monophosphate synthetase